MPWTGLLCIFIFTLTEFPFGTVAEINVATAERFNGNKQILYETWSQIDITETPLHTAARNDDSEEISRLLKESHDIYEKDSRSLTPMQVAVFHEKRKSIIALAEGGYDVNEWIDGNDTLLYSALILGLNESVQTLREIGAVIDCTFPDGSTYLHRAVDKTDLSLALWLIKEGIGVNVLNGQKQTAFEMAVRQDKPAFINLFAANDANLEEQSSEGEDYLTLAFKSGKVKALKNLLRRGIGMDKRNEFLRKAVENDDIALADVLLAAGANIHQRFRHDSLTLLHWAGDRGSAKIIPWLVVKGIDVNVQDGSSWSAMHQAAYQGNLDCVQVLFELGCCINCENSDGKTALGVADQYHHTDVIRYLRSKGGLM